MRPYASSLILSPQTLSGMEVTVIPTASGSSQLVDFFITDAATLIDYFAAMLSPVMSTTRLTPVAADPCRCDAEFSYWRYVTPVWILR